MATKLKRYTVPILSPIEKISNTVKKQKFVTALLKNSDTLTPLKIKHFAQDAGWGERPQDAINDKEVQQILKPITDQLISIRQKVVQALNEKDFRNERSNDLTDIMDKLTKNIQLLTGGETEKHKVVFGWDTGTVINLTDVNANASTNIAQQTGDHSLLSAQLGTEAS